MVGCLFFLSQSPAESICWVAQTNLRISFATKEDLLLQNIVPVLPLVLISFYLPNHDSVAAAALCSTHSVLQQNYQRRVKVFMLATKQLRNLTSHPPCAPARFAKGKVHDSG